jgi:type II secretory pathway pseudopilin PulG
MSRCPPCQPRPRVVQLSGRIEEDDGFTLLGLLVVVVIINIGLGVAVTSWMTIDQRAKEAELIWRGQQYIRALQCHRDQTGGYPEELDELLESDCIRALYPDPMSRAGEWRLLRENDLQPASGGGAGRGAAALDAIDRELRGPEAFFEGGPLGAGRPGGLQGLGAPGAGRAGGLQGLGAPGAGRSGGLAGQRPPQAGGGRGGGAQQGPDSLRNDSLRQAFERFSALGRALDERTGGGNRIVGVASTSTESALRIYQGELTYDAWWFLAQ